jgi:hypothetical protein
MASSFQMASAISPGRSYPVIHNMVGATQSKPNGKVQMAKQRTGKGGVNKSATIRDLLAKNPKAQVKEIVAACQEQGITVHPNLVYLIKSKLKEKKQRAKRKRAEEAVAATEKAGFASPVELIIEVRKLSQKAGGIKHLKELVDLLAE